MAKRGTHTLMLVFKRKTHPFPATPPPSPLAPSLLPVPPTSPLAPSLLQPSPASHFCCYLRMCKRGS